MTPKEVEDLAAHWTSAQRTVAAFVRSLVTDFHESEEVLQRVAVTLVRKYGQYDPARPFVAWALGVAKLEALMFLRERRSERLVFDDALVARIAESHERAAQEPSPMPQFVSECVEELDGRARQAIQLRYGGNLRTAQNRAGDATQRRRGADALEPGANAVAQVRRSAHRPMEGRAVNNDPTTLIHAYLDGELTGRERRRTDRLARRGSDQRRSFRGRVPVAQRIVRHPRRWFGRSGCRVNRVVSRQRSDHRPSFIPPIILDSSPTTDEPLLTSLFAPGGFLFSYTMSARDRGDRPADRLDVERSPTINGRSSNAPRRGKSRGRSIGSRRRRRSAGSPAWSIAGGPIPRPATFDRDSRSAGPQVRPGLGLHGNHLRHGGQGHPPGAGDAMRSNRPAAAFSRWAS